MAFNRKAKSVELSLPSLSDIIFLLLTFFLLTSNYVELDEILDIKLPSAKGTESQERQNNLIEISLDGRINFNGTRVTKEVLQFKLNKLINDFPDEVVVVRADKRASYSDVVSVMGICKSANVKRLGLAALMEE
ncbi:MAG: biopolymer transporter ExbD [Candidatus Firestonebacteria bacterium]|nr:biopolymer transporter ExbD [Candidatus Firestonebacteria bacterium]